MAGMHTYNTTGIVARGRIYIGTDNQLYAFKTPGGPPTPTRRRQVALPLHQQLVQPPQRPLLHR
jgi:hypothetical protein